MFRRWLVWGGAGWLAVGGAGCVADPRPRTVEREPAGADRGSLEAGTDGGPLDAAAGDAAGDAAAGDAGPAPCVVVVTPAAGAARSCTLAPAPLPSCQALADCLCALAEPADREVCRTALLAPRALVNLSDYCNGQVDLGQVLARGDWAELAPVKFELEAAAACADHPAAL